MILPSTPSCSRACHHGASSPSSSISSSSSIPVVFAAVFIFAVGIVTLGLGFLFYALLPPAVVMWALVYYGLTFGSPSSATIGMRVMDLEMRTWYGAPCLFRARRRSCHRVLDFGFDAHPLHPARVPSSTIAAACCTTCWSAPSSSTTTTGRACCAPLIARLEVEATSPLTKAAGRARVWRGPVAVLPGGTRT